MTALTAVEFLKAPGKIFDVRSPGEYDQGHIPEAVNLPLFSDTERAVVGTAYKRAGKEEAFQLGLEFAAKKIPCFIEEIVRQSEGVTAKIHCSRGGLRSQSFMILFQMLGVKSVALQGGYKSFRGLCNYLFEREADFRIIGGMTGSGKTKILQTLKNLGEQTIDLEALSNHRGSVFGTIEGKEQPTTEQFHNLIGSELLGFNRAKPIWIEDESRLIGRCHLPESLYLQLQTSPLYLIERSLEMRLERLKQDYGGEKEELLISCIRKLRKKLGNEKTDAMIESIRKGNFKEAATLILNYYDLAYRFSLSKRKGASIIVDLPRLSESEIADWLVTPGRA